MKQQSSIVMNLNVANPYMKTIKYFLILFISIVVFFACSSSGKSQRIDATSSDSENDEYVAAKESRRGITGGNSRKESDKRKPSASGKKTKRLMIYEASLQNTVKELDSAVTRTKTLIQKYQGYIEKQIIQKQPARAIFRIRVPVENFDLVVNELSQIGKVNSRNIKAQDITKAFSDLSQKLENRQRLLKRLYVILKKTKKTKQKIRILNEIARLQKQIDLMLARKKYLARKASFSTIDIQFHAVKKLVIHTGSAISWILRLEPQKRTLWNTAKFTIPLPTGFINNLESFKNRGSTLFLSPDGVKIRATTIQNDPYGNIEFYKKALLFDQKRFPDVPLVKSSNKNKFILTTPRQIGYQTSIYTLMIMVHDNDLHIVEVLYPDKKTYDKHKAAVENSLDKLEFKSIFQNLLEVIW